jgi:hypothetical protein
MNQNNIQDFIFGIGTLGLCILMFLGILFHINFLTMIFLILFIVSFCFFVWYYLFLPIMRILGRIRNGS